MTEGNRFAGRWWRVYEDEEIEEEKRGNKLSKKPLRVYLAAAFSRKLEIAEKAEQLRRLGLIVTSSWLTEKAAPNSTLDQFSHESNEQIALVDIDDIQGADILVLFSNSPTTPMVRGGRIWESGFAYGINKQILVVGPRENIFYYLPDIEVVETWEQAVAVLISKSGRTDELRPF